MAAVSGFHKFARTNQNEAESGQLLEEGIGVIAGDEAVRGSIKSRKPCRSKQAPDLIYITFPIDFQGFDGQIPGQLHLNRFLLKSVILSGTKWSEESLMAW